MQHSSMLPNKFTPDKARGVYTMVRSHKATQNESNLLFLVTFFAIMTLSEQIKVSQSSPSMWLSVLEKI